MTTFNGAFTMAVMTHGSLETDARMAAILDEEMRVNLTDMADIRSLPGAIANLGTVNGSMSDTHQIRFINLGGADPFVADATEVAQVVGTNLTDTSVPIAVVRQTLGREISDLAIMTGSSNDLDPARLARDLPLSYARRFQDLIAALLAAFTTTAGATGVDFSVDDFYDATYELEQADNNGPYYAMMHGVQFSHFRESLRAEGGALQFLPPTGAMLALKNQGYQGNFLNVDTFKSSRVTDDGVDYFGGMWGSGAMAYKTAQHDAKMFMGSSAIAVTQGEVLVEIAHVAGGGKVEVFGDAYVGVATLEQARACLLQSGV
jgi:hypothetical protein